jgi:cytochrome c
MKTAADGPKLGQPASAADIQKFDISVGPDGANLPVGKGNAKLGAQVYAAKCQSCHGEKGQGKPADALVGGVNSLASNKPVRTVGSFWPYASTLFDYTRRAMPLQNPKSLTNDEVYSVSAYILFLNGIIAEDYEVNQKTLTSIRMPNRNGFIDYSQKTGAH